MDAPAVIYYTQCRPTTKLCKFDVRKLEIQLQEFPLHLSSDKSLDVLHKDLDAVITYSRSVFFDSFKKLLY